MARKSFKDNPAMRFITSPDLKAETGGPEPKSSLATDRKAREGNMREGQEGGRINVSFTPEEFHYLQTIARLEGLSITGYINRLISTDRQVRQAELDETDK